MPTALLDGRLLVALEYDDRIASEIWLWTSGAG
jgi:hypothetical protein